MVLKLFRNKVTVLFATIVFNIIISKLFKNIKNNLKKSTACPYNQTQETFPFLPLFQGFKIKHTKRDSVLS